MVDTTKPFFLQTNEGFGSYSEADDLLHPHLNAAQPGDSLTETQFLSFSIPEHNIHALGYLWQHPNLGVVTGGIWAFQGIKKHVLACELFDFRTYMSDAALRQNDLHEYRLVNGYGVKLLEPLKKFHMTYKDESRQNEVDVVLTAVTPPVMFGSGMHFEQGMKAVGKLVLRGTEYKVDTYSIRDRSWGQLRPEDPLNLPPLTWMTCVFHENFMFNCSAFDHPDLNPEWQGEFDLPPQATLKGGWIYKDGVLTEITSCVKRTTHDPDTLYPHHIEMTITDSTGSEYHVTGDIVAGCAWNAWPNFTFPVCVARWRCNGLIGHGEAQEAQWPEFYRKFHDKLGN